jgi:hypothetical protein
LMTEGFSSDLLISTFYSIDRYVFKRLKFRRKRSNPEGGTFFLVLYYVLKIFRTVYSELKLFFRAGQGSLKEKTVLFFNTVFSKSLDEYENINRVSVLTVKPAVFDYFFMAGQAACLSAALLIKQWMI